ncbi:hypothetical protein [Metabacillus litoralis]|uniref:hypothetical protein n=1 Tax=Metabacillus litoralis TaxID=152268 RepID=UPI001CFCEA74|nr:hypothetical protein [Metabacillus litoralis]
MMKRKGDSSDENNNTEITIVDDDQREEFFDRAIELYYHAISGKKDAGKEAHSLFNSLLHDQPQDTELMAYLGAVKALLARDEINLREKGKYANEGLKLLDIAVLKDASNPLIRMLRGNVANNLPENRFRRTQTAIEDFEHIVELYEKNPHAIPESLYVDVMKSLVTANERLGKNYFAKKYANKVKELEPSYQLPRLRDSNNNETNIEDIKPIFIKEELISLYKSAIDGNETSLHKVTEQFLELEKQIPADPTIEAFITHCRSMKSTLQSAGYVELFTTAIKTSQSLDKLVSDYPNFYNIRLVRAFQSYRLPEFFFYRTSTAARDFHYLASEFEKDSSIFSMQQYQEILLVLGQCFTKLGMVEEAIQTWNKLVKFSPHSKLAKEANKCIEVFSFEEVDINNLSIDSIKELYSIGHTLHELGVSGSEKAANQAVEVWDLASKQNSDCSIAKFYYAASLTLLGKYCHDSYELFRVTMKGLKKLDQALPNYSVEHIDLYLKRANILLPLPDSFFHCNDKIIKDFETVIKIFENSEEQINITRDQYLQVLADLGTIYERKYYSHKAKEVWDKLAKEDQNLAFKEFLNIKLS